jgi:hypothetical protein
MGVVAREGLTLDILWLKDESLENSANLPPTDVIAAEMIRRFPIGSPFGSPIYVGRPTTSIVEDLEAALAQFAEVD